VKMLVTGGTGFIGSRLALAARDQGHSIVVAGQLNTNAERTRAQELARAGIVLDQGSLQDPAYARRVVQDCQNVIHLAAAQHEANVPDQYFIDVNVNATRTLIEACEAARVGRFVYGSTIGIYGESTGQALDESTPPRPGNVYGRSKLQAEELVNSHRDTLPISIVRISETYGPGDFRLLKLFRAEQLRSQRRVFRRRMRLPVSIRRDPKWIQPSHPLGDCGKIHHQLFSSDFLRNSRRHE